MPLLRLQWEAQCVRKSSLSFFKKPSYYGMFLCHGCKSYRVSCSHQHRATEEHSTHIRPHGFSALAPQGLNASTHRPLSLTGFPVVPQTHHAWSPRLAFVRVVPFSEELLPYGAQAILPPTGQWEAPALSPCTPGPDWSDLSLSLADVIGYTYLFTVWLPHEVVSTLSTGILSLLLSAVSPKHPACHRAVAV